MKLAKKNSWLYKYRWVFRLSKPCWVLNFQVNPLSFFRSLAWSFKRTIFVWTRPAPNTVAWSRSSIGRWLRSCEFFIVVRAPWVFASLRFATGMGNSTWLRIPCFLCSEMEIPRCYRPRTKLSAKNVGVFVSNFQYNGLLKRCYTWGEGDSRTANDDERWNSTNGATDAVSSTTGRHSFNGKLIFKYWSFAKNEYMGEGVAYSEDPLILMHTSKQGLRYRFSAKRLSLRCRSGKQRP